MNKEAGYYKKLSNSEVRCCLCPHRCRIEDGQSGFCKVRQNTGGILYAATYGMVSAAGMDPVEKKPLYHFHPGKMILSLGQAGCTFHCDFCQNYHMLSPDIPMQPLLPRDAARLASERGSFAIAYTYNEPWVSYEYVLDTAMEVRSSGLKNVLVTNGYYMQEPFEEIVPYVDAMNIDLKSIRGEFYRTWSHGALAPVKRTIEQALEAGVHVELTTLLITGLNDSEEEIRALADYIAGLSPDIPLHISRYRPAYKMDRPPTPVETMEKAHEIASKALNYVYLGNMAGAGGTESRCPGCGSVLVSRKGFAARLHALGPGRCNECGREVNFRI